MVLTNTKIVKNSGEVLFKADSKINSKLKVRAIGQFYLSSRQRLTF